MKKLLVSTLALALASGVAVAQSTSAPSSSAAPSSSSSTTTTTTTTITPAQETAVKTFLMKEKTASTTLPSGVTLTEGAVLPDSVSLSKFDSSVNGLSSYSYVVTEGRTALVEPSSRKVVKIIETK